MKKTGMKKMFRQGDVLIVAVDEMPAGFWTLPDGIEAAVRAQLSEAA